jgi:hypothetical protein
MNKSSDNRLHVTRVGTTDAEAWIAFQDEATGYDYCYGGTRIAPCDTDDQSMNDIAARLALGESALKNRLINIAIQTGALDNLPAEQLPAGFMRSKVGGARCVIRPVTEDAHSALSDPSHPRFLDVARPLFSAIGDYLNRMEGWIKLTPDYGRFAGVADLLNQFTPHVLGIRREAGGCGGKSSYSATGIVTAVHALVNESATRYTIIGSDGAMGRVVTENLLSGLPSDTVVCDLKYRSSSVHADGRQFKVMPAENGKFTDRCLERGGVIVATTIGNELVNSTIDVISPGTLMLLGHNMSFPAGRRGTDLAQALARRQILTVPGQPLTLGGALTSRLEWFSRQEGRPSFDKPMAHRVVRAVVSHIIRRIVLESSGNSRTPLDNTFDLAEAA